MNKHIFKCRNGVVLLKIHGVYLLASDMQARKACTYVRQINEIGAFIWKQLEMGTDVDKILFLLYSQYDINKEYDLKKDVLAFIESLVKHNYLIKED